MTSHSDINNFIERWACSGAAERANYQIFLTELCGVLEVPHPEPTKLDEAVVEVKRFHQHLCTMRVGAKALDGLIDFL